MVREEIRKGIERYLKVKYAKRIEDAEEFEIFNAVSLTIMEEIIDQWNDTKELYGDGKQAFYLSAEYLMGRALGNNLISTGLYDDVKAVLEELNIDINKIEEIEEDAGLGNGEIIGFEEMNTIIKQLVDLWNTRTPKERGGANG